MKNFFISILLIAVGAALLQSFMAWWTMAVVAFVVAFFVRQSGWLSFLAGFVAVFALWVGYAFMLSSANDHLLATKVTELFKTLTAGNAVVLYIITGIVGGLISGLAALSGHFAAKL